MNTIGNLFSAGNPIIMLTLTVILLLAIYLFSQRWLSKSENVFSKISLKDLGLLAFVIGIAAQLGGLYAMFGALQEVGDVAPVMIYGGLRVTLIAPIYGATILAASLSLQHLLKLKN